MNRELFVQNVEYLSKRKGVSRTAACIESGVGSSFLPDVKRGRTPSLENFEKLARYLEVTVSELIGEVSPGETKKPAPVNGDGLTEQARELLDCYEKLNDEGQGVLLGVARSMVLSGQYIKAGQNRMDKDA